MSNKERISSSESHEKLFLYNEPSDETILLSSRDNEKLENEKDWLTEFISILQVLMLGGGYLFVLFTLTTRKGCTPTCHSSQNMVASITFACHFNNGMGASIPSITRSSEFANNSISKFVSIEAKIHSNTSKASSFHRTESFNRTKTTFFFSIKPPTVHPQYRVLSKKMDQSPSSCRAIIENPNFGAIGRTRGNFWISKQDKKKDKHSFSSFRRGFFWRSLRKRVQIRKRTSGTRALIKQIVDRSKNYDSDDTTVLTGVALMVALFQSNPTNVATAINLLPLCIKILNKGSESAPQVLKTVDDIAGKYLPAIDSAINVCDAVRRKNNNPVDKQIQMEQSAIDTKVQETLLSAINDSGLLVVVTEATKQDIQGVKEKDGSFHRFTTIEQLWPSDYIEDVQMAFREGNPRPIFSQIAATQYLCTWNSSLMISLGAPQSRQRILDNTFAFQTRMRNQLNKIVTFKKPVSQSDLLFTQFHIWANSMSYMRKTLEETEKQSVNKPDEYWQQREPELIAMGFKKGCEKYQAKLGIEISPSELESYIKEFIDKKLF